MIPDLSVLWVIVLVLALTFVVQRFLFGPLLHVMHERESATAKAQALAAEAGRRAQAATVDYEAQMSAAISSAKAQGFTHVAFGDLFLDDIRRYREERMKGTGLVPMFPLWMRPTDALAREMIRSGLDAHLTCVDPRVLPASFAGRRFDAELLADLPASVDPCGERGEFHTCAVAGPMFRNRIHVAPGMVVERDGFVFADLIPGAGIRGPGSEDQ